MLNLKFRNIIIKSDGLVRELGVFAPIFKPTVVDISTLYRIIRAGHQVFELREDGVEIALDVNNYNKGDVVSTPDTKVINHPDEDGWLHVPKVGTSNDGRFLRAGDEPKEMGWTYVTTKEVKVTGEVNKSLHDKIGDLDKGIKIAANFYPLFSFAEVKYGMNPKLIVPDNGFIKAIKVTCEHLGSEDCIIQLKKTRMSDYIANIPNYSGILNNNIVIKPGQRTTQPVAIMNDRLFVDDIIVLEVLQDGKGVLGLNIQLIVDRLF